MTARAGSASIRAHDVGDCAGRPSFRAYRLRRRVWSLDVCARPVSACATVVRPRARGILLRATRPRRCARSVRESAWSLVRRARLVWSAEWAVCSRACAEAFCAWTVVERARAMPARVWCWSMSAHDAFDGETRLGRRACSPQCRARSLRGRARRAPRVSFRLTQSAWTFVARASTRQVRARRLCGQEPGGRACASVRHVMSSTLPRMSQALTTGVVDAEERAILSFGSNCFGG